MRNIVLLVVLSFTAVAAFAQTLPENPTAGTIEVWYSRLPASVVPHGWAETHLDNPSRDIYTRGPCTITSNYAFVARREMLGWDKVVKSVVVLVDKGSVKQIVVQSAAGRFIFSTERINGSITIAHAEEKKLAFATDCGDIELLPQEVQEKLATPLLLVRK